MQNLARLYRRLSSQGGMTTLEWIALGSLVTIILAVVGTAMSRADGTGLAQELLNAIARMVRKIQ
jgi:hypothetical protein